MFEKTIPITGKQTDDRELTLPLVPVVDHGLRAGRLPFRGLSMNVYKVPAKGYLPVNCYLLTDEDTGHGFLESFMCASSRRMLAQ